MSNRAYNLRKITKPAAHAPVVAADDDGEEPKYNPINLKMVRRLAVWLRPYKRQYITGISVGAVMILLQMTGPSFVQHLVDYTTSFVHGDLGPNVTRAGAMRHSALVILLWG